MDEPHTYNNMDEHTRTHYFSRSHTVPRFQVSSLSFKPQAPSFQEETHPTTPTQVPHINTARKMLREYV